ncbi:hypothetical protein E7Y31_16810 [Candidatus Frankia alpina]|uniref:Uncharacterized protein n=1 Tax=Candidatus Frankia alpina TaxID=2699483 RepID=A0A4S5E7Y1_9ACTN|nr:hypothetical protein E7Y31_16810 [Candidatus Frankia alpina]
MAGSVPATNAANVGRPSTEEKQMAKYLLLKHYRGAPASINDVPMDRWTPSERPSGPHRSGRRRPLISCRASPGRDSVRNQPSLRRPWTPGRCLSPNPR